MVAALAAGLAVASALPAGSAPLDATGPLGVAADKWIHAGGYAVLAAAVAATLGRRPGARVVLLVLLAVVGFGLGVEGVQAVLPWRDGAPGDAAANAAGAALALAAWWGRAALGERTGAAGQEADSG